RSPILESIVRIPSRRPSAVASKTSTDVATHTAWRVFRKMFVSLLVSSLVAVAPSAIQAQERLSAQSSAGIDSLFTTYAHSGSPGCAVGVFQNGATVFARGYGFANLTYDVPITPETRFTVGSVSKQFTAATIALLVRAGRISLDDDVRKYVPELPVYSPPVRVRHLVHHTSGLRDFWELVSLAGMRLDDGYGVDDMFALAIRQKGLNFTPGAEYRYSNTGYLTIGVLVKRVTGQSLRRFADSAMFAPLGMNETMFLDNHNEIVSRRAAAYSPNGKGWQIDIWNNDLVGQGGIVTSLEDLQKWDENFYTAKVGGREFIDLMQTTEPLNNGSKNVYAFGVLMETYRGQRLVAHTGATGGYRAALFRFPDQHTSFAMMCNASTANTDALCLRMADVVLRESLGAKTMVPEGAGVAASSARAGGAIALAERRAIVGRYVSTELNDSVWEVALGRDSSSLQLLRPRNAPIPLVATDSAYQYSTSSGGITLRFSPPAKGRSAGFVLDGSRVSAIRFARITP
ncbi:MAG: serine hydrolase domain-containing protein, partial [Gemmatimonadaceae bacterium]